MAEQGKDQRKMSEIDESPRKKMKTSHNEEEEEEWREVFQFFDKDGNGTVSVSEMGMLLRGLGMNPTEKDVDNIISKFDADGSKQIEWEEFVQFMRNMKKSSEDERMDEMLRAFKIFDYNDDGHIDASELRRIVTSLGEKLTEEQANLMIDEADVDQDGKINYKEFSKFIIAPKLK